MFKYFIKGISILSLCAVMSACSQSSSTTTLLSTEMSTLIPTLTKTPHPTLTPTITITPYSTLSTQRPHWLIRQSEQVVVEYDAEGLGRKIIELPYDGYIPFYPGLDSLVSPDGKWLAFYTGNLSYGNLDTQETLPVTLNLLNISNGKVIKITDIVTDGYTEQLGKLVDELIQLYPDDYKSTDSRDWVFSSVSGAFAESIHAMRWSPDGHDLAFAAQIDGVSSDVYLYSLDTGSIKRIESSILNVATINWSPDGQYIIYRNFKPNFEYLLYAAQPSGYVDNPKELYSADWLHTGPWLSTNHLLIADGTDTPYIVNMQSLDIRTGQLRPLWADAVDDYAIDSLNKTILLNTGELAEPETFGVYIIKYNGQKAKVLDGLYSATLFFRGGKQHRFLMQGFSHTSTNPTLSLTGDIVGFDMQGSPVSIVGKYDYDKITISPDKAWLLTYDENNLYLYDADDILVQTFPANGVYKVIWRTDSQAIFFLDGQAIYFLSIPYGRPRLVDECKEDSCLMMDNTWLP